MDIKINNKTGDLSNDYYPASKEISEKYREEIQKINNSFKEAQIESQKRAIESFYAQNEYRDKINRARIKEQNDTAQTAITLEKLYSRMEKEFEETVKREKKNRWVTGITLCIVVLTFIKDLYGFISSLISR